jgi:hypothetical protein
VSVAINTFPTIAASEEKHDHHLNWFVVGTAVAVLTNRNLLGIEIDSSVRRGVVIQMNPEGKK